MSRMSLLSLGLLALAPITSAAPSGPAKTKSTKNCIDLEVSVPIEAYQWRYDQPRVDSNIDAMDWHVNVTTPSAPPFSERRIGDAKQHIKEIFKISAKLCVPSQKTEKSDILQIASPGQAFDKRYFDVEIDPEEYSYIDAAIAKGYSVLAYDRLGTGASSKPDAYDILQLPVDTELLASLTKIARDGKLISSSKVLSKPTKKTAEFDFTPSKIVHIGHAYGAFLMIQMLGKYGTISDGALVTGVYPNKYMAPEQMLNVLNYNHAYVKELDPKRFADYSSGYFVLDNEQTLQKLFYQKVSLDPALLTYTEKIKQPESVGQYASEFDLEASQASDFKAPVMFFTGELDNFICKGDCNDLYDEDMARYLFPSATDITPYLQPRGGHATGLSKGASAGYEVMLKYLDSKGL